MNVRHDRSSRWAVALAAAVLGVALPGTSPAIAATTTQTVVIDGTAFSPLTLTVRRGDRVRWVNKDPFPHTATASDRSFDSHDIAPGKSWTYVARKQGSFDYVCTLHPNMKGTLVVQ